MWELEEVTKDLEKTTKLVYQTIEETGANVMQKQAMKGNWEFEKEQYLEAYGKMLELINNLKNM